LQIEIGSAREELAYYRVSDKLVAGVGASQLAVLFVENLSVEGSFDRGR
jgi:hypothetical protein